LNIYEHLEHIQTLREELFIQSAKIGNLLIADKDLFTRLQLFFSLSKEFIENKKFSFLIKRFHGMQLDEIAESHYYYLLRDINEFYKSEKDEGVLNSFLGIPYVDFESSL
jgi:hypothetical protein